MIDNDAINIIKNNINNDEIKRYATKYKKQSRRIYPKIKNNDDVSKYLNAARNMENFYEKDYLGELSEEDMESMEIALANYENAVSKVLNSYGKPNCDFHYNAKEIKELIDNVYEFDACIDNEWIRKACQYN